MPKEEALFRCTVRSSTKKQLAAGNPVIVFARVNARSGYVLVREPGFYTIEWKSSDDGDLITIPMYKHNLVVEGFRGPAENPEVFHIIDPFYGEKMDMTPVELRGILEGYRYSGVVVKF